jgi:hypothetical protein
LGLSAGEDIFCESENKHDRRAAPKPNCLVKEITETNVTNPKFVVVSRPVKIYPVLINLLILTIIYEEIRLFRRGDYRKIRMQD